MDIPKEPREGFGWFIWGLVGLGAIWFFTGGTESPTAHEGQYLEAPEPLDSGRAYGKYYEGSDSQKQETLNLPRAPGNLLRKTDIAVGSLLTEQQKIAETPVVSLTAKKIFFKDFARARSDDPDEEYLRLEANARAKTTERLSGLVLRGVGFNISILIPKAARLPILGEPTEKTDVFLPPGGEAVIASGRSPIGASFQVNKCSGYLDQFQDYTPKLEKRCPLATDELEAYGPYSEKACAELVETIARCRIYQGAPPQSLSGACVNFLAEKLNYNACVANHKTDTDFYAKEWRLFLNQPKELWRDDDEIIRLMSGTDVMDAITY